MLILLNLLAFLVPLLQSSQLILSADGQILNWGWVLDSLTTARTLGYYKRAPSLAQKWQVIIVDWQFVKFKEILNFWTNSWYENRF